MTQSPPFGSVPCPSCGAAWVDRTWVTEGRTFPAFSVCFDCAAVALVDVGPFGYLVRPATAAETAADPRLAEIRDQVVTFKKHAAEGEQRDD